MENICESFNYFEERKVYEMLQDDISRKIFEKRICFSYTNDYRYIEELSALVSQNSARSEVGKIVRSDLLKVYFDILEQIKEKLKAGNKKIVVCGALNGYGRTMASILAEYNPILCDKKSVEGIIPTKQACEEYTDAVYVISSKKYYSEIEEELLNNGIKKKNIIFIHASFYDFFSSLECLYSVYSKYDDSEKTESQYFEEDFLEFSDNEVFVDCGFYDGATTRGFIEKVQGKYDDIIAFEPDIDLYTVAKNNTLFSKVDLYNKGCWSSTCNLNFKKRPGGASLCVDDGDETICVAAIDDIMKNRKTTYIKMDIEGSELEALKGAVQTIKKFKPKLAISIYHKPMDIIEIPLFILSLRSDYKFYLRHYCANQCDTVLYAI